MTARNAGIKSDLGRLLAGKVAAFNGLNSATGALCESLARQDFREIERLVAARGELAAEVDGLDGRIRDLNEKFPSYIADLKDAARDEIRALVRELRDVTRTAVDLDNNCLAAASAFLENLGSDISMMSGKKHLFNSYSGQGGRTKILDVKT